MLELLLRDVRACAVCAPALEAGVRPVLQAGASARVLIAGQAPGRKVHASGVPFNDVSGDRLRDWLAIDRATFYDPEQIALLPMGFCYPGTYPAHGSRRGDLPPRPECAPLWRARLLAQLPRIELTILLGRYALDGHATQLQARGVVARGSVAAVAAQWQRSAPQLFPLPHPSPRNRRWLQQNPWFEAELLPALRERISSVLNV